MTKDVAVDPAEPVLWLHLAQAQMGLKNYLDAETNYKKALELESKTGRPEPEFMGVANSGLGEVYARTLMVDEANAAFDAAARADPAMAATLPHEPGHHLLSGEECPRAGGCRR